MTEPRVSAREIEHLLTGGGLASLMLNRSFDAITVADFDGRILWVNDRLLDQTGLTREQLIGHTDEEFDFYLEPEIRAAMVVALRDEGRFGPRMARFSFMNATQHVEFYAEVVDVGGEPLVVTISRAVTLQIEAESRLREAQITFQNLVEQLPGAVYLEQLSGSAEKHTFYASPRYEEMFGLMPRGDIPARENWQRLIHPDDIDRVIEESDRTDRTEEPYVCEYRVVPEGRPVMWVRDEAVLVRDDDGIPQYWLGFLSDISERRAADARLRAAEDRYRVLIEHIPVATYTQAYGSERGFFVSPQIEQITGWPARMFEQAEGWDTVVHPDDRLRVREEAERTDAAREPFDLEYRMVKPDGSDVWIHDVAALVDGLDGEPSFWHGIIEDVTARRSSEDQLRRHDAILEAVGFAAAQFLHAESWTDCIDDVLRHMGVAGDVSRAYIFRNARGVDETLRASLTHEWVSEEATSQLSNPHLQNLAVSAPSSGDGGQPAWTRRLSEGGAYAAVRSRFDEAELPLLESQGILSILETPIFVGDEWWGFLVFDDCRTEREWSPAEVDALRAAAGVLGAVIERQETEAQLLKAEERHRLLIEQLPAVVYIDSIDHSSTALYISPQVEEMLGYTAEERIATPMLWVDSIHPADREMVLTESDRTNETGDPFAMDYRMVARDGRTVWVRDEAKIVRDEDGTPLHWQGVMFDITERKMAEQELERALRLEREAAERLRSLDDMKNTFLTAVSHDLRTPLAAVLGLALTLEREDIDLDGVETRDLAHRIATNARKLERLVTDLLDLDRLSRGILEPNLSRTDLGLLVRKVVEEMDLSGHHPITVEAEATEISVDTAKVERIVENLVSNSARHTPAGTRIWIRVHPEGDGALLVVEDEGSGVSTDLREAVFEPFRQGPGSEPSPGVGIGLSLVARFAELHGGRAWVAEREGGGASFRVFLPERP